MARLILDLISGRTAVLAGIGLEERTQQRITNSPLEAFRYRWPKGGGVVLAGGSRQLLRASSLKCSLSFWTFTGLCCTASGILQSTPFSPCRLFSRFFG